MRGNICASAQGYIRQSARLAVGDLRGRKAEMAVPIEFAELENIAYTCKKSNGQTTGE